MSLGLAPQSTSGWRRKVPVAEHGASRSTAANRRGSRQVSAGATAISAARPVRASVSRRRASLGAGAVERGDIERLAAASCKGLAAGGGADVEHRFAGLRRQPAAPGSGRRRRPAPTRGPRHNLAKPSHRRAARCVGRPRPAARPPTPPPAPRRRRDRAGFKVARRLVRNDRGDGARRVLAERRPPAGEEPWAARASPGSVSTGGSRSTPRSTPLIRPLNERVVFDRSARRTVVSTAAKAGVSR